MKSIKDLVTLALQDLASEGGEENSPVFDDEARCYFTFIDRVMALDVDEEQNSFNVSIRVLEEGEIDEKVIKNALTANFFWLKTKGATLMMDPNVSEIILCFKGNEEDLESSRFLQILQNLYDCAIFFRENFQNKEVSSRLKETDNQIKGNHIIMP